MVNFVIGKLHEEDRRMLITDLYELQLCMDRDLDTNQISNLVTKKEDLEFKTLVEANSSMQDIKQAQASLTGQTLLTEPDRPDQDT